MEEVKKLGYVPVFTSFLEDFSDLTEEEIGRLLVGALRYSETGKEPQFTGNERFLWANMKRTVDSFEKKYADRCEKNKKIAQDRAAKQKAARAEEGKKEKTERFTQPTETETAAYFVEIGGSAAVAQNFLDYYDSVGWCVGKQRMRDWRAAARRWLRAEKEKPAKDAPADDWLSRAI